MRTIITTAAVVALLAAGTGTAAARPTRTPAGPSKAGIRADGLRYQALGAWYRHHTTVVPSPDAQDAARGVYLGMRAARTGRVVLPPPDVQDAARGVYPGMQAVRAVEVTGPGFDWTDAGIGASFAAAVLLSAAAATMLRRQHRHHPTH